VPYYTAARILGNARGFIRAAVVYNNNFKRHILALYTCNSFL
jgi:hypothetical protein